MDFKSIVYKKNGFTHESLEALSVLFKHRVPFHLEELKLIDLKITSKCCEDLLITLN